MGHPKSITELLSEHLPRVMSPLDSLQARQIIDRLRASPAAHHFAKHGYKVLANALSTAAQHKGGIVFRPLGRSGGYAIRTPASELAAQKQLRRESEIAYLFGANLSTHNPETRRRTTLALYNELAQLDPQRLSRLANRSTRPEIEVETPRPITDNPPT